MKSKKNHEPLPRFKTDDDAERFIDEADLSRYDLTGFTPTSFEFEKKTARVNMRLPEPMLEAVKAKARERGIPYQRYIREAIERALGSNAI